MSYVISIGEWVIAPLFLSVLLLLWAKHFNIYAAQSHPDTHTHTHTHTQSILSDKTSPGLFQQQDWNENLVWCITYECLAGGGRTEPIKTSAAAAERSLTQHVTPHRYTHASMSKLYWRSLRNIVCPPECAAAYLCHNSIFKN